MKDDELLDQFWRTRDDVKRLSSDCLILWVLTLGTLCAAIVCAAFTYRVYLDVKALDAKLSVWTEGKK